MSEVTLNRIKAVVSMRPKALARPQNSFERGRAFAFKEIADIIDCINPDNVQPEKFNDGDIVYEIEATGFPRQMPDGTVVTRLNNKNGLLDVTFKGMKFIPLSDNRPDIAGNFKIIVKKIKDDHIENIKEGDLNNYDLKIKQEPKAGNGIVWQIADPFGGRPVIQDDVPVAQDEADEAIEENHIRRVAPVKARRRAINDYHDFIEQYANFLNPDANR